MVGNFHADTIDPLLLDRRNLCAELLVSWVTVSSVQDYWQRVSAFRDSIPSEVGFTRLRT